MKKLLLLLAVGMLCFSCTKGNRTVSSFKDYVETDFDDPGDFIRITEIKTIDTLNSEKILSLIQKMEDIDYIFTKSQKKELEDLRETFEHDNTQIITREIKVRERVGDESKIRVYYAIDDGKKIRIQKHILKAKEAPDHFQKFFIFCQKTLK